MKERDRLSSTFGDVSDISSEQSEEFEYVFEEEEEEEDIESGQSKEEQVQHEPQEEQADEDPSKEEEIEEDASDEEQVGEDRSEPKEVEEATKVETSEEEVEEELIEEEEEEEDVETASEKENFVEETSEEEPVKEELSKEHIESGQSKEEQVQHEPQEEQADEDPSKEEEIEEDASDEEQVEEDRNEPKEVEEAIVGGEATKVETSEEEVEEELIEEELSEEECTEELIEEVHSEKESIEGSHQEEMIEEKDKQTHGRESRVGKSVLTMSQQYSENCNKEHQSGQNQSLSSEKKRKMSVKQVFTRKKCKQEMPSEANSDPDPPCTYHQDATERCSKLIPDKSTSNERKMSGSSGKKRHSRWDCQSEGPVSFGGNDEVAKRRKTRWDNDDNQLKMLGPLQLPDFTVKLDNGAKCDLEIQKLNKQLLEINKKLLGPVGREISNDRLEKESSLSPSPIYKELGIQTNIREERHHRKLIKKKQEIIAKLIQKNLLATSVMENIVPPRHHKKLYIPTKEFPGYNFIGLILGPRGSNQKRMEMETGAKILLRGRGSEREGISAKKHGVPSHHDNDDLHVLIEADNQESLDAAVLMVEKLLVPLVEEQNELKKAQLRELARMQGKLRCDSSCLTCGDTGHSTSSCPLTAPTPESKLDRYATNFLGEIGGGGFFSSSNSQVNPYSTSSGTKPAVCSLSSNSAPLAKEMDIANLFVGYLPQSMDEAGLAQLFSSFGTIRNTKVIRDHATGVSKGYGFVRYSDPTSAAKAVEQMNRFQIGGKTLAVRVAGHPPPVTPQSSSSLRPNSVGQLPSYPGPPNIPQPFPGLLALSRPPVSSIPGSCSAFPQTGSLLTHTGRLMVPPASFVSYAAPAIPSGSTDIFTAADFANFAGNPDKFGSNPQSTWFSPIVSRSQVPNDKAANYPSNPDNPTSVYHFHQVTPGSFSPATSKNTTSPVEAANFPGNPDHISTLFYQ